MVGLHVKGHKKQDNTESSFNLVNASVVMNLTLDLIDKQVVPSAQLVIVTFNCAQY